jgi:MFS family permease
MFNAVADVGGFWVAMVVISVGRFGNNVPVSVLADHTPSSRWNLLMGINRAVGDLGLILGPIVAGLLLQTLGYGQSTVLWAVLLWISALTVMVGVREARERPPVLGGVRAMWSSRRRNDRP